MMDELKPCPFCGEQPELTTYFIKGTANHTNVYASCSCGHKTRSRKGVDGAIADWNTRPIEDALQARIAEIEAENAELKRKLANEERMVERLIEAGERLRDYAILVSADHPMGDGQMALKDKSMWDALAAECKKDSQLVSNAYKLKETK